MCIFLYFENVVHAKDGSEWNEYQAYRVLGQSGIQVPLIENHG